MNLHHMIVFMTHQNKNSQGGKTVDFMVAKGWLLIWDRRKVTANSYGASF